MPAPDRELKERLKAAIWYTVGKIVDEECLVLGVNATPQYIAALTELVYSQTVTLGTDLEAFAHHAKRKVISTDDVKMMCRRNEGLRDVLDEFVRDQSERRTSENKPKRRA
ncbi:kinetochore component CENP-S-domain-containing protein [Dipodascopsis tothii]|uniref:kinetochore component CENP-S-domain-containing protein n=1 Tax=Dipodascopsis tothii TaxID=44089 RepID=UPI0034CDBA06